MKLLFCDLDGTLIGRDFIIPKKHLRALKMLKDNGWYLVAATGRNPYSIEKVLTDETPFDEVMFTTGVGVMRWPSREIIYSLTLSDDIVEKSITLFDDCEFDVMAQQPHPHNHHFLYLQKQSVSSDAQRRISLYKNFAQPATKDELMSCSAANIVAIGNPSDDMWHKVIDALPEATVVRATSPLDGKSMWLEVYPKKAGKLNAAHSIASRLNINLADSVAVGNDYNDVDLLLACGKSYMVKSFDKFSEFPKFYPMNPPEECGFYDIVREKLL